ncbi:MAG TPA: hypothetical protein VGB45_07680 [Abditibacterium sp.]|jgi:hypothetical protein
MLLNQFGQTFPQNNSDLSRGELIQLARETEFLHSTLQRLEKGRHDQDYLRSAFGLQGTAGAQAYQTSDPMRYQMPHDPKFRPFSPLSVDMLRVLARSNDIASDCITHLKREVTKVPLKVALKDEKDTSREAKNQLAKAKDWLSEAGGLGGYGVSRAVFEGQMIDDLLIVGAAALVLEFETRGDRLDGKPSQIRAIDAATIQPLVSPRGFLRGNDEPAFLQWVQGVPVGQFTRAEIIYEGLPSFARSDSPYFMSPTEDAAIQIYTLMRVDEWNRTWLTEGSGYRRWLKLNESVTPDQAKAWLEIMKLQSQGNAEERHGIGVAPGEITGDESRKDQDFDGYENGRAVRICGSYGVNPASIGRHGEEHKDDQEAALGATRGGIVGEILTWREHLYNRLLTMMGLDRVVVTEDVPSPSETTAERSTRQAQEIAGGVRTVNMVMAENGAESVPGGDELLFPATLKPLSQILAPPPAPVAPGGEELPADLTDDGQIPGQENTAKTPSGQSEQQTEVDKNSDKTPDIARAAAVLDGTPKHKFSCVMAYLAEDATKMVRDFAGATINPEDLTEDGFETEPHITLRYGLHTSDPGEVAEKLSGRGGFRAAVSGVSYFASSETGRPYDVVKLDVLGHDGDLSDIHSKLDELPHTDTFADYKPHITLAYVKAGCGAKYTGEFPFWNGSDSLDHGLGENSWLRFTDVRFSSQSGDATTIDLSTGHQRVIERVLGQWERKSLRRLENGKSAACAFESEFLLDDDVQGIYGDLTNARTKGAVREVFEVARMAKRGKTTSNPHNTSSSFASFWGGESRDETTKEHFNGKNISVTYENEQEVQKRVQAIFGKQVSAADLKHLAGAPDGATVSVSPHPREASSVVIMVDHSLLQPWAPDKGGAVQTLEMGVANGRSTIFYDALSTTGEVPGFGSRMMGYTIEAARSLGMGSITLHAAGEPGDKEFSGYKAWARMGFDAALSPDVQDKQRNLPDLPAHVRQATMVSELHRTSEGADFWKHHGESFVGTFDLNLKSFAGQRSEAVKQSFFEQSGIKLR